MVFGDYQPYGMVLSADLTIYELWRGSRSLLLPRSLQGLEQSSRLALDPWTE